MSNESHEVALNLRHYDVRCYIHVPEQFLCEHLVNGHGVKHRKVAGQCVKEVCNVPEVEVFALEKVLQ